MSAAAAPAAAAPLEAALAALRAAVDALYAYKEGSCGEELGAKQARLEALAAAAAAVPLDAAAAAGAPLSAKAEAAFLRGRALDAGPAFCAEAEECLPRAVRLDPASAEAWGLGHCLW